MKISQINGSDIGGGAEKIALSLHKYYLSHSQDAHLYVYKKYSAIQHVSELPIPPAIHEVFKVLRYHKGNFSKIYHQVQNAIKNRFNLERGIEHFQLPNAAEIAKMLSRNSDIIHLHNLHGRYFDLNILPGLAKPVMLTMHDEWLYTGHCASALDCEKWKSGCGSCPYLFTYPEIKRDQTNTNWLYKKNILAKKDYFIAAPSKWLYDRAKMSLLEPQEIRVIHNGIDLDIFSRGDKLKERRELNLDPAMFVILYIANKGTKNLFRDYVTVFEAIKLAAPEQVVKNFVLLAIGGEDYSTGVEQDVPIIHIPYIKDEYLLASYYRAADALLYATQADNYPTIILEAMACGLAVIATDVGGICEQVQDGQSGFLVPKGNARVMAEKILALLESRDLSNRMGFFAAEYAKTHFSVELMAKKYLDWYHEIINNPKERDSF